MMRPSIVLARSFALAGLLTMTAIGDRIFVPLEVQRWTSVAGAADAVFTFQWAAMILCALTAARALPSHFCVPTCRLSWWASVGAGMSAAATAMLLADILYRLREALFIVSQSTVQPGSNTLLMDARLRLEVRCAFAVLLGAEIVLVAAQRKDQPIVSTPKKLSTFAVDVLGACLIAGSLLWVWARCATAVQQLAVEDHALTATSLAPGLISLSKSYVPLIVGVLCLAVARFLPLASFQRTAADVPATSLGT